MSFYEGSGNRRVRWEANDVPARFAQGYLLDETLDSVRFENTEMDAFGFYHSRIEGGHWLSVNLGQVDFSQTQFRHVYFEDVDFRKCSFASTVFEACTFVRCRFPASEDADFARHRCHEAQAPAPEAVVAVASAPAIARVTTPPATSPNPAPAAPIVADRFARLER